MIASVVLFIFAVAIGAVNFWDIGGIATRLRSNLENQPVTGGLYKRLPSWHLRAFGIWCFVFGVGQLVYVYIVTHGSS